ncbi:hypothetical protein CAPTEDRAFT_229307 [Capitella teleta]|uniref:Centromere protein U n=1 Tax=Capitella teleta TaxID=283909 RepID=R7VM10_CAPTE|nr:hypothetical protein CAPTEDRAFT_229307 [Capitella teleta]|eukprot:ELU18721.1 hypothetical protein CAPTEDRAFT_229307 [Capitella teleta]
MPQTIDLIISQESGNKENAFDALTRGDSQSHSASTSPLSSRPTPGKNYARRRSGTPKASLSSRKRLLTTESSSIGKRRRVMLMDVMSSSSDDEQDHNSKSKGLKGINRSKTKLHKVAFAANPLEHGEGNSTVNFTLAEDLPGATSKNTSPKPTKKNSEVPEADESIAANNETTVLDDPQFQLWQGDDGNLARKGTDVLDLDIALNVVESTLFTFRERLEKGPIRKAVNLLGKQMQSVIREKIIETHHLKQLKQATKRSHKSLQKSRKSLLEAQRNKTRMLERREVITQDKDNINREHELQGVSQFLSRLEAFIIKRKDT